MANRFPLIINAGLQQIQELASGDGLDLSGSDISNVGNVNVASVATIATGNIATINGTLATVTTGNIATINGTLATVTTGNIATINGTLATVTTGNIATLNGTLATVATGNITTVNSTTINSTTINSTTVNPTTINLVRFIETIVGNGNTSGTITPNIALGSIQLYTLTGNITLNSILNIVNGASMTIILKQDATGGRTLTSTMKFSGGSKTLSTAPNSVDILSIVYASTTSDYYVTLSKGYV